jgi:hypothetical protein
VTSLSKGGAQYWPKMLSNPPIRVKPFVCRLLNESFFTQDTWAQWRVDKWSWALNRKWNSPWTCAHVLLHDRVCVDCRSLQTY